MRVDGKSQGVDGGVPVCALLGARTGVASVSPGPNKRTWSDAGEVESVNAIVS